jgi:hypothetical protein
LILAAETICILAGTLPLVAGFFQSNLSPVAIGCFMIGLIWLLSQWRRWIMVASFGLFVFVVAAGIGIWIGLSPFLMAVSVLGSLSAWDLAGFSLRLRRAAPEDDLRKLEKNHLVRLAGLAAIGLVLILAAAFSHLRISFGWLFLLAIAVVLGMMQLVNHLRRGG